MGLYVLPPNSGVAVVPSAANGETVYPNDPRFSKAVLDEEARVRVKARVDDFAQDVLASARAERGLPHLYFTELREAVRAGLGAQARAEGLRPNRDTAQEALAARYEESRSSYAKTGDPGLGQPELVPRPSERFTQPEQGPLRALAQEKETFEDLTNGKPLRAMTIEVRQPKGPGAAELKVLVSSGDALFDAFVLRSWPAAMVQLKPPPDDVSSAEAARSIWAIEAWQRTRPNDEYLPSFMGFPMSRLASLARDEGYDFHVRLLRAY